MVKDINNKTTDSMLPYREMFSKGNTIYFAANDGEHGKELWKSDGTEAGTVMVKDINIEDDKNSYISKITSANNTLYFYAIDSSHGRELWKSDGTEEGTVMVKDINFGSNHGIPTSINTKIVSIGDTIYFLANDGEHGNELWQSDGTEAGTVMVEDANNSSSNNSIHNQLTSVDNVIYFINKNAEDYILWKTDGTPKGTVEIKRSIYRIYIHPIQDLEGKILYRIENTENWNFREDTLYVYDGSTSTQLTK
jgi:ELWxxDGT repeat protein